MNNGRWASVIYAEKGKGKREKGKGKKGRARCGAGVLAR
jgi:hypothetical protein